MTSKINDRTFLLSEQYKTGEKLNARIELHRRFSVNQQGWMSWVFDHCRFSNSSKILELGCGPATLWQENLERIPIGWDIALMVGKDILLENRWAEFEKFLRSELKQKGQVVITKVSGIFEAF